MGLFGRKRKASRRNDARAWAVALDREPDDKRGKNDFGDSMNTHLTLEAAAFGDSMNTHMTYDAAAATDDDAPLRATPTPSGGADDEVRQLQLRVRRRDATIARLRAIMEAGERVQSDRIALLERQLERLVESPSRGREQRHVSLDPGREGPSPQAQAQGDAPEERGFRLELSAMNELLARVLAEKDRLGSENERLRSLVKNRGGRSFVFKMPRSIVELDKVMKTENEENCHSGFNIPAVHYKMSCRYGPRDQSRPRYMGTFTPTTPANSRKELPRIVMAHFSQVWGMVREENGGRSSNPPGERDGDVRDFPTSSLARHCVEHCKCFSSKKEVMHWCTDNVKVEVLRKEGEEREEKRAPPSEKERRKKKKKKHGKGGKEGKKKVVKPVEI